MFYNKKLLVKLFAVIHLFISSHDEIKDFCPMDKLMCIIPLCTIYTFLTIKITKKPDMPIL